MLFNINIWYFFIHFIIVLFIALFCVVLVIFVIDTKKILHKVEQEHKSVLLLFSLCVCVCGWMCAYV